MLMSRTKDSACSAAKKGGCCLVPLRHVRKLQQMLAVKCQTTLCDKHLPSWQPKETALFANSDAHGQLHTHTHI